MNQITAQSVPISRAADLGIRAHSPSAPFSGLRFVAVTGVEHPETPATWTETSRIEAVGPISVLRPQSLRFCPSEDGHALRRSAAGRSTHDPNCVAQVAGAPRSGAGGANESSLLEQE